MFENKRKSPVPTIHRLYMNTNVSQRLDQSRIANHLQISFNLNSADYDAERFQVIVQAKVLEGDVKEDRVVGQKMSKKQIEIEQDLPPVAIQSKIAPELADAFPAEQIMSKNCKNLKILKSGLPQMEPRFTVKR